MEGIVVSATRLTNLQADSIDGVIESLSRIIEWCKENDHRAGYFPALYRKVTVRIRDGIEAGEFEDAERMERFDVIFANRYLEAFEQWQGGVQPIKVWQQAFDLSERWPPIVLQHLVIGMNAHISFDLGISAAETVPKGDLPELKNDFDKINKVLASMVDEVQIELAQIWPLFRVMDLLAGRLDEKLAGCSLEAARKEAWDWAQEYSNTAGEQRQRAVEEMDNKIFKRGKEVASPRLLLRITCLLIRVGELQSVRRVIEILR